MYDRLHYLYLSGQLSDAGLQNAVTKGWITQAQADQIRADKAAQDADVLNALLVDSLEN